MDALNGLMDGFATALTPMRASSSEFMGPDLRVDGAVVVCAWTVPV